MARPTLPARAGIATSSILFLILSGVAPLLLSSDVGFAAHAQCSDGLDNDHNRRTDFPQDGSCDSIDDDFEGQGTSAVFVSVTDGKDGVRAGDSLIYIISLVQQREDWKNVTVDFHIPAEVDLLGVSDGGDVSERTVVWNTVTLEKNIAKRMTVQARVRTTAPQGHLVVARVSTEGTVATDVTRVKGPAVFPQEAPFRVTITDHRDFVSTQSHLTFILTGKNLTGEERTVRVAALLPTQVVLDDIPADARLENRKLVWDNVTFGPQEERRFSFTVRIPERLQNYHPIYTRALVDGVSASDTTVIRTGFPMHALDVHISANHDAIARGDILTYTVDVENTTSQVATAAAVNASLPIYGEFVSVTEGGFWDGRSIHWRKLQIAPHGTRTLTYAIRIRPDAPIGNRLLASTDADGAKDTVFSIVSERTNDTDTGNLRHARSPRSEQRGLFGKHADHSEVLPDGQIRYTITVLNVLLHPIRDAVVTDRFNPSQLTVMNAGNARIESSGTLEWTVPELAPGQEWSVRYVLAVLPEVPHGTRIRNIARITGSDITDATVSERVSVTQTGVVAVLPPTGAPLDVAMALLLFPLALGPAWLQRRRVM